MQTFYEINYGIKSDVGRVRKNNEDYVTCFIPTDAEELKKNGSLFIVADGVGGAAKGEVASRFAGDTVRYEYYHNTNTPPAERLACAMQKASREIFEHSQANGNFTRMATTMVAALVLQNNLIVAHVGDSRLYLMRDGKIKQLTRDHSVVAEMVRNGVMTEEEARTSKAKNRLSRSIGGEAEVHVDVSEPLPLNLGDRILLCSDGLTRYLDGEDLKNVALKDDVETTVKELVKNANEQGGIDNVSVILLEMVQKARMKVRRPAARQAPPEKLGWDEAQTEYPQIPVPQKRKLPVWAIIATSAIVLGVILSNIMIGESDEKKVPISETEASIQATAGIGKRTETPTPATPTPATSSTQSTNNSISTGGTPIIPAGTTGVIGDWICIYQVQWTDTIGSILRKYTLSIDTTISGGRNENSDEFKYYDEKSCSVSGIRLICSGEPVSYSDNDKINIGEWIIIYSSRENKEIHYLEEDQDIVWGKADCLKSIGEKEKDAYVIELGGN